MHFWDKKGRKKVVIFGYFVTKIKIVPQWHSMAHPENLTMWYLLTNFS